MQTSESHSDADNRDPHHISPPKVANLLPNGSPRDVFLAKNRSHLERFTVDVFVYFNLHPNHFSDYEHDHSLKKVFSYTAPEEGEPQTLADQAFRAFNAPPELIPETYREIVNNYRTVGLRSLSIGDALRVGETWLACAATGWIELEQAPRIEPMPDSPVDLLVVTPAGEVRDYVVEADHGGLVTSRGILEALYDQIGCTHVDVVALSPGRHATGS